MKDYSHSFRITHNKSATNESAVEQRIALPKSDQQRRQVVLRGKRSWCISSVLFVAGGPWAPFENNWHLRDEYKKPRNKSKLARQ